MPEALAPTWFGHWKDDGFIKVRNMGRVDAQRRWADIRETWLADYRSRAAIPGRCVKRVVGSDDEWCAEAYMETDYSALDRADFERVIREYAIFLLMSENLPPAPPDLQEAEYDSHEDM